MKIRYHLISTILFITTIGYTTSISGNVLKLDGLSEPGYCESNPQITEETRSYEDFHKEIFFRFNISEK